MNLRDLQIPNTLPEIIAKYKEFKHEAFESWCVLHYTEAYHEKGKFLDQIKLCAKNQDSKSTVRVCIAACVLGKYSTSRLEDCIKILCEIKPTKETVADEFITLYIAKFCNRMRNSMSNVIIIDQIKYISELLKPGKGKIDNMHAVNLMYNFASIATRAIDQCSNHFLDAVQEGFMHQAQEIRFESFKTINKYFEQTRQRQFPQFLYNKATNLITLNNIQKKQGGFLILVSLVDYFPECFMDNADYFMKVSKESLAQNENKVLAHVLNLLQIAIAPLNPNKYKSNIERVLNIIWNQPEKELKPTKEIIDITETLLFIMKKFPEAYQCKIRRLLRLLSILLSSKDEVFNSIGSKFILQFMEKMPSEFDSNQKDIAYILINARYNDEVIHTLKKIISKYNEVWEEMKPCMRNKFLKMLEDHNFYQAVVKMIANLPPLSEDCVTAISPRIHALLSEPDFSLKKLVPAAMLALAECQSPATRLQLGTALVTSAMTDPSDEMRLAILESFREPYPEFLAFPGVLDSFSVLVNDESYRVRKVALRILGKVGANNPAMIYPMFRRVILDILFICGSSKSLRVQTDATRCLPIVFSSVQPILPIYVPVFIPIALQYLEKHLTVATFEPDDPQQVKAMPTFTGRVMSYGSMSSLPKQVSFGSFDPNQIPRSSFRPLPVSVEAPQLPEMTDERLTFFERIFSRKIAVNYIRSIGCICENNFELIRPQIGEICELFMKMVGRAAHKKVLLATLNTFESIVSKLGPTKTSQIQGLNTTLLKLGARLISSKVHTAIFRLLGQIGPVQPYRHQTVYESSIRDYDEFDLSIPLSDYYARVAVKNLFFILDDKSESTLHHNAYQALCQLFTQVEPSPNIQRLFNAYVVRLLTVLHSVPEDERTDYFSILSQMLRCPTEWLQKFASLFFRLIEDFWQTSNQTDLFELIPQLANALKEEFSPFLPKITSMLLDTLKNKQTIDDGIAIKVLETLTKLSKFAYNFVFIIVRHVVEAISNPLVPHDTVFTALNSLRSLVQQYDCTTYSSLIVRSCLYALRYKDEVFKQMVLHVLLSLAVKMGRNFIDFKDSLVEHGIFICEFEKIISCPTKCKLSDFDYIYVDPVEEEVVQENIKYTIDDRELTMRTQINTGQSTHEQWKQWIRSFIYAFIVNSPSPAIQSCISIAHKSSLFNRKIFNAAFLSVWSNLDLSTKMVIQAQISQALTENKTPMSVTTALIGLVEFADRAMLPIEGNSYNRIIAATRAEKYTYALHCAQLDFDISPDSYLSIDKLIQIYSNLGMFDEAKGLEKLFGQLTKEDESLLNKLKRLEQHEDWEKIINTFPMFDSLPTPDKQQAGLIYANAFLSQRKWPEFERAIASATDSIDAIIMKCVHQLTFNHNIDNLIHDGFHMLGQQGGPLFLHGFSAVAPSIVHAQQLVELSEYANHKENLISLWEDRLYHTSCYFNTIRPLLSVRMEVLRNQDALPEMLSFLRLARKAKEWDAFEAFFDQHFVSDPTNLHVAYEHLQLLWQKGEEQQALDKLDKLITKSESGTDPIILCRLYLKKAQWLSSDKSTNEIEKMTTIKNLCESSLAVRSEHYRTNNLWAWANMRLFDLKVGDVEQNAINAITGFTRCVLIEPKNTFSDLLQMSAVLFRCSSNANVFKECKEMISNIQLKHFITIVPQLIVYQMTHSPELREFVKDILSRLLCQYPNSVIFSLIFMENLGSEIDNSSEILQPFALSHPEMYQKAKVIVQSLTNACVTISEYFYEGLSNLKNQISKGQIKEIMESYEQFKSRSSNPTCQYDRQFLTKYNDKLKMIMDTYEKCLSDDKDEIRRSRFEDKYHDINNFYSCIKADVGKEVKLSLKNLAPQLEDMKCSLLSVFGTFEPDQPIISFKKFCDDIGVKMTKQRPRKIMIEGSNGKKYKFLLKGHEDLRLDQRMMQFFELMNSFVPSSQPRITITAITPLSTCSGLIQWIPGCDTMNQLINNIRQIREQPIDAEVRLIGNDSIDNVDALMPVQRLESMRVVMKETGANDLRDVMWLKAPDSESWVKHVLNFSKTSALMSIVGYVIGLGDRHTANIMIQRFSGSVIHIDFGDCFEITKERAQLAEKIPFRLTRMMIAAFGPCRIDGSFRRTCEDTAQTIRDHREAVMAVLEIFMRQPVTSGGFFAQIQPEDGISGSVNITEFISEKEKQISSDKKQKRLMKIMSRISDKINGLDFENTVPLTVHEQVDSLIKSATDIYNLSYLYHGWKPYW